MGGSRRASGLGSWRPGAEPGGLLWCAGASVALPRRDCERPAPPHWTWRSNCARTASQACARRNLDLLHEGVGNAHGAFEGRDDGVHDGHGGVRRRGARRLSSRRARGEVAAAARRPTAHPKMRPELQQGSQFFWFSRRAPFCQCVFTSVAVCRCQVAAASRLLPPGVRLRRHHDSSSGFLASDESCRAQPKAGGRGGSRVVRSPSRHIVNWTWDASLTARLPR